MSLGAQIKQWIREYQGTEPVFSPYLTEDTIALIKEESAFTYSYIDELALLLENGLDTSNAKTTIRTYLKNRWEAIKAGNIAYTRHPFLPVNQLCLKLAEAIAEVDEPICQVLMPTIKGLNRDFYSLKSETEEDDHFRPELFMLNNHATQLISVEEVFSIAAVNTNKVFLDFQADQSQIQFNFSSRELFNLEHITGKASKTYFHALREHHALQFNDRSIGFAIRKLATSLKKGAVGDAGTEESAHSEIISESIKEFYDLWKSLPEETKHQVNEFKLVQYGNSHLRLESYFLTLFARHPDCPLNEEELKRVKEDDIFNCADQISNYLDEFLKQHPKLFLIKVGGGNSKVELPPLKSLMEEAIQSLETRGQMTDGDDNGLFINLTELMLKVNPFSDDSLKEVAARMAKHVTGQHLIVLSNYKGHFRAFFPHVLPRIGTILNEANIGQFISSLHSQDLPLVIDVFSDQLIQWINPKNYAILDRKLYSSDRASFVYKLATKIAGDIHSLEECQSILKKWHAQHIVQKRLFTLLKPKLNNWIKSGSNLLEMINALPGFSLELVLEFAHLVSDRKLFKSCLKLIPGEHREQYLKVVQFELFISNIGELKEVASLLTTARHRSIIYNKFDKEKLNCTQEEFSELTKAPSNRINVDRLLEQFDSYNGMNTQRQEMIAKLTSQLQSGLLSDEQIIEVLKSAQKEIAEEYNHGYGSFFSRPTNSRLYSTLTSALSIIDEDASEPSSRPSF